MGGEANIFSATFRAAELVEKDIPEAFASNSYSKVVRVAERMTDEIGQFPTSYACAPIDSTERKHFIAEYYNRHTVEKYRPKIVCSYGLFQVDSTPVFNAPDEPNHEFSRLFPHLSICELG